MRKMPDNSEPKTETDIEYESLEGLARGHLTQLELGIKREREPDRNHALGGRSFYFFDLDDNVMFLDTKIFIFHRETGEELALSTGEFAAVSRIIAKPGPLEQYETRLDDATGSFRRFRDLGELQDPSH